MKKSILYVAALALTFAACQPKGDVEDKFIGTFEEAAISPAELNSEFTFKVDTAAKLVSGNFELSQTVAYGGTYVTGGVVANYTDTKYETYTDAYKLYIGQAYAGKNYAVWYADSFASDAITLKKAAKVPGMYITNTAWVVDAIKNGDGMSDQPGGFTYDDWLLLTITGWNGETTTGTVEFYLAKDNEYVTQWEYVDLGKLGKIDKLTFAITGTKTNTYGLTTPTYFAFDNLGAKK